MEIWWKFVYWWINILEHGWKISILQFWEVCICIDCIWNIKYSKFPLLIESFNNLKFYAIKHWVSPGAACSSTVSISSFSIFLLPSHRYSSISVIYLFELILNFFCILTLPVFLSIVIAYKINNYLVFDKIRMDI